MALNPLTSGARLSYRLKTSRGEIRCSLHILRSTFAAALAVAWLLTVCHAGFAQSTFGTVLGTVKDPSGSFVPKAKVQLVNAGTNAVREEETSRDGRYQFNNVDVGNYQLRVEASGFQTTTYQPFDLAARDTTRVDIDLQVASQATSVTVEVVAAIQDKAPWMRR